MGNFPLLSSILSHYNVPLRSYMEIGVCDGRSIKSVIGEYPTLERIVLSDTWQDEYGGSGKGSHDHIIDMLKECGFGLEKAIFLDGDSKETVPCFFNSNKDEFDVIFVDGDHSPLGCLTDIANCIEHCTILIVDDTRHILYGFIKDICYAFYDTIKERFYMIDDGKDFIYFIRKDFWR